MYSSLINKNKKMKTNFITKTIKNNILKQFQDIAYQILYGNYIDKKFKNVYDVHNFRDLVSKYGKENINNINSLIYFYKIDETESTDIVTFLDKNLNILSRVETISEVDKFY